MDISVIIPSYNRKDRLEVCLQKLLKQKFSGSFEIIVVNDGSTDDTKSFLENFKKKHKSLITLHQKNSGQGIARNHALKKAKGEIILIIGDDIYADSGFLQAHLNFHRKHPKENFACLGKTDWWESSKQSDFMHWLTDSGVQFAYEKMKAGQRQNFKHFYTSNVSLKKDLLDKEQFDTDFKAYGWEDIELAYRLEKKHDLNLIYTPKAHAFHDDPVDIPRHIKRSESIGRGAIVFQKKHPELNIAPNGLKLMILKLIGSNCAVQILKRLSERFKKLRPCYWYSLTKHHFLEGMKHV